MFPYPSENFHEGASTFYSVSSVSSHPLYSLQPNRGTALDALRKPGGLPSYTCEQLPSGTLPDHTVTPVSTNPLLHPESDEEKELDAPRQPGECPSTYACKLPMILHLTTQCHRFHLVNIALQSHSEEHYSTPLHHLEECLPTSPSRLLKYHKFLRDSPYPQESSGGKAPDSLTSPGGVPPYPTETPPDDATPDHLVPLVLSNPPYLSESGEGAAPNCPTSTGGVPPYPSEQAPDDATSHHSVPLVLSDPPYPSESGGGTAPNYPTPLGEYNLTHSSSLLVMFHPTIQRERS